MQTKLDITQQMQAMIKDIDIMNDELVNSTVETLKDGAEIIADEQRRLISGKSSKLAGLIKVGKIVTTKKGNANVLVGYDSEAIEKAPEGVILEFGRPSGKKSVDKLGRKIGKMNAIPHIRKGFDNKKEEATNKVVERLDSIIKERWSK